jgi:uncharacterized DUF497 family protein
MSTPIDESRWPGSPDLEEPPRNGEHSIALALLPDLFVHVERRDRLRIIRARLANRKERAIIEPR